MTSLIPHLGNARVGTVMGRYYGMDRNKTWSRTELAYEAIVNAKGNHATPDPLSAVTQAYNRGESDEFITTTIIDGYPGLQDHDAIIHFNLRSDRARQLTKSLVQSDFEKRNAATGCFTRSRVPRDVMFVAMTDFGPDLAGVLTAYPALQLRGTFPMAVATKRQMYIAESEKYAHVTYFFNGGYADPVANETRVMVPSPDVPFYDQAPAMKTPEITDRIVTAITTGGFQIVVANFANLDMVAHTGNLAASIQAMEVMDACLGKLEQAVVAAGGTLVVTADHGNIEELKNSQTGEVDTEHSTNPVPFYIVGSNRQGVKLRNGGALGDIAPTLLQILGLPQPSEMTGRSLLV